MANINLTCGTSFASEKGNTLLEAATSAGVILPHSCCTGRCGTCKAFLRAGVTRPLQDELGLSADELAAGWILTCVRSADSDISIDIEDLSRFPLPKPLTLPCRISEIESMAPDILRVKLRLPPTVNFGHLPGQYINVIGPSGERRSYSLANADLSEKVLELHIKRLDSGLMSDYWFNKAQQDDLLRLNGPHGTFFLRDFKERDVFFLATGTGIAPVHAMLKSMTQLPDIEQPRSVTVFWGGRKTEDLYLNIAKLPGKHTFVPVLSRPEEEWRGETGYVQNVMLARSPDLSNAAIYACGSDQMIQDASKLLLAEGLPAKSFYSDAFVSSSLT